MQQTKTTTKPKSKQINGKKEKNDGKGTSKRESKLLPPCEFLPLALLFDYITSTA